MKRKKKSQALLLTLAIIFLAYLAIQNPNIRDFIATASILVKLLYDLCLDKNQNKPPSSRPNGR